MNYAPSTAAHDMMWQDWQPDVLQRDFLRIAGLNANVVRFFVYVTSAGFPIPSNRYLDKLARGVELAANDCLQVQLSLFAYFTAYDDLAASKRWAKDLLSIFQGDRRLAFVELQNEIDSSNPKALAWASDMASYVHSLLPGVPLTISVAGDQLTGLRRLKEAQVAVDFYDLHFYTQPQSAVQTLASATELARPRPLFIGEAGYSSLVRPGPYDAAWWECQQALFLRRVAKAAGELGLPPPAPWIYSDFEGAAFRKGTPPSQVASEMQYGLYRIDGSAKPAARVVERTFEGEPVDTGINNSFEQGRALPDCWLIWEGSHASFSLDHSVAHTGSASARISSSSSTSEGLPAFYLAPLIDVVAGKKTTAAVWARGMQSTGRNLVALSWFNSEGRFISTSSSPSLSLGTTGWTHLEVSGIAPQGAAYVEVQLVSADNNGTVWFDDVSVN